MAQAESKNTPLLCETVQKRYEVQRLKLLREFGPGDEHLEVSLTTES